MALESLQDMIDDDNITSVDKLVESLRIETFKKEIKKKIKFGNYIENF